jgi:hypothetical protein
MKKNILLILGVIVIICLWAYGLHAGNSKIADEKNVSVEQTESNRDEQLSTTTDILREGWEYFDMNLFSKKAVEENEIHFLITEEVSLQGKVYKTEGENTNALWNCFQNLQVKKTSQVVAYADYYILLRDENNVANCLIAVWKNYICINQRDCYEVANNELLLKVKYIIKESIELKKVSSDEILLSYVEENLYGKFSVDDIVLYQQKPAIMVSSGYEKNDAGEQLYYEKYICIDGMYFEADYQTTYAISQTTLYYKDGNVIDEYYNMVAYYDCFTGERMPFYFFY